MKGSAHRCIGPPRPQCDQAMESSTTNRDPLLRDRPSPDHPRESPRCGEPRQRLADGPQCPDNQTCSPTTTTAAADEMPGFLVSKRCPPLAANGSRARPGSELPQNGTSRAPNSQHYFESNWWERQKNPWATYAQGNREELGFVFRRQGGSGPENPVRGRIRAVRREVGNAPVKCENGRFRAEPTVYRQSPGS